MDDGDAILVRVLAHHDAVRLPVREWEGYANQNRYFALQAAGVPFRMNTGGSEAARKGGERRLLDLADAGLVAVRRGPGLKFPLVAPTPAGDARARALAGLPDRHAGRLFLGAVVERAAKYIDTISGRWCPEIDLNGGRGWGDDATPEDRRGLGLVEQFYLAAAAAGWVDVGSTGRGHVAYVPTAAGLAELARPAGDHPPPADAPEPDPEAVRLYRDEQDAKLRELDARRPDNTREIGPVPLIVSMLLALDGEEDDAPPDPPPGPAPKKARRPRGRKPARTAPALTPSPEPTR